MKYSSEKKFLDSLKLLLFFWLCFKKFGCIGGTQTMEIVSLFIIFLGQNKKTPFLNFLYTRCVARDQVILLEHPLPSWMERCVCSMWVNVGDWTKINYLET